MLNLNLHMQSCGLFRTLNDSPVYDNCLCIAVCLCLRYLCLPSIAFVTVCFYSPAQRVKGTLKIFSSIFYLLSFIGIGVSLDSH